jgi:hypothetical protein
LDRTTQELTRPTCFWLRRRGASVSRIRYSSRGLERHPAQRGYQSDRAQSHHGYAACRAARNRFRGGYQTNLRSEYRRQMTARTRVRARRSAVSPRQLRQLRQLVAVAVATVTCGVAAQERLTRDWLTHHSATGLQHVIRTVLTDQQTPSTSSAGNSVPMTPATACYPSRKALRERLAYSVRRRSCSNSDASDLRGVSCGPGSWWGGILRSSGTGFTKPAYTPSAACCPWCGRVQSGTPNPASWARL